MLTNMSSMTMKTAHELAAYLRKTRKQRRLSQIELAERANIARGALQKLEGGRGTINLDTLLKLLHTLSLDIALEDRSHSHVAGTHTHAASVQTHAVNAPDHSHRR